MKELKAFGLPVSIDEISNEIIISGNEIHCEASSKKTLSQMKGLLFDDSKIGNNDETCYLFYTNIIKDKDLNLFKEKKNSNGITVLMPGTMSGECRKNSGHFHGYVNGHSLTLPEAYEILTGEAAFLLQKSTNFDKVEEDLVIEKFKVVFLKEGDKIIVPPFYAHCAINVGDGPMAFGNLAAPSPLLYDPIKKLHGFAYYVMKKNNRIIFVPNTKYKNAPQIEIVEARENYNLGIQFDKSLYTSFVENPDKFEFLHNPEKFIEEIESMLV